MRRASEWCLSGFGPLRAVAVMASMVCAWGQATAALVAPPCDKPVYLTIDTGHMGVAPLIVDILARHQVHATFFLANERTQAVGDRPEGSTLDANWAAWWKALAGRGHDFGSHTWDHVVWKADQAGGFSMKATSGPQTGQLLQLTPADYCAELARPARRFEEMTGHPMRALFRAPGGKTSPALLKAAQACGWQHVGWADAGFLGDELPSDRFPNQRLLDQALQRIRQGDILMMHLGIWSRKEPWAPAVLEPLIVGLQARGMCFATLREHPQFAKAGAAPR
jgi:peptidoglycan-N-acetylmuramic acid deacetylase